MIVVQFKKRILVILKILFVTKDVIGTDRVPVRHDETRMTHLAQRHRGCSWVSVESRNEVVPCDKTSSFYERKFC